MDRDQGYSQTLSASTPAHHVNPAHLVNNSNLHPEQIPALPAVPSKVRGRSPSRSPSLTEKDPGAVEKQRPYIDAQRVKLKHHPNKHARAHASFPQNKMATSASSTPTPRPRSGETPEPEPLRRPSRDRWRLSAGLAAKSGGESGHQGPELAKLTPRLQCEPPTVQRCVAAQGSPGGGGGGGGNNTPRWRLLARPRSGGVIVPKPRCGPHPVREQRAGAPRTPRTPRALLTPTGLGSGTRGPRPAGASGPTARPWRRDLQSPRSA